MIQKIIPMILLAHLVSGHAGMPRADDDRMQWFDDARFGMFIHWGVYAVHGNKWPGKPHADAGNDSPKKLSEWLMQRVPVPVMEYRSLAKQFTAANYDPAAWAGLARDAGMKYVVITSKHHDGFALWPTAFSDWNVSITPAKNDLLAPLAEACRKEGLKFGFYYSQCQDWVNPGGAKRNPYCKEGGKRHMDDGDGWDELQKGPYDDYLQKVALPQVNELLERYQPDIIWWDTPVHMNEKRAKPFYEAVAKYPEIITNSRLGGPYRGDTRNPEQWVPPEGYPGERFEVCMTMNDSWGYASDDHNWKSTTALLQILSDTVSKGGNLLLNIGPKADGGIPEPVLDRLREISAWMRSHGRSIHGTQASPYPRQLPWGRMTRKRKPTGEEILYLHIWEWPADGEILLPTIKQAPVSAALLPDGRALASELNRQGLVVRLAGARAPDPHISVVELIFKEAVSVTAPAFLAADADGVFRLGARDADRYGSTAGVIEVTGRGAEAALSNWTHPAWHLKYRVQSPARAAFRMSARISTTAGSQLKINCGAPAFAASIPNTNGEWRDIDLGELTLPAGESAIVVKTGEKWTPVKIRTVTLAPINKPETSEK
ncbi:MAG: alpha-L-fucosidase [Opitutaceae bacterium]|nr:alpha-L-fucosidase [Opitutaceae bacterium]